MFEQDDDVIERVVHELRRPVQVDPAVDARVMEEVARLRVRRDRGGGRAAVAAWRWLTQPRTIALSPLGGLGIAAVLAALALALPERRPGSAPPSERATREFQFVVVAPLAARVSLVGDFNDWDAARTPMRRIRGGGGSVWTAVVPLWPGRYRYAFLVDGSRWLADPTAPAVRDDEFGTPSSVVTVGSS